GFAEALVQEAASRDGAQVQRVLSATVHRQEAGASVRVTGEATCLATGPVETWRCAILDAEGTPMAQVVLTLLPGPPVVALAPARPSGEAPAQPDERRAGIARAAVEVIADKGYAAATMREIAAA